MVASKHQSTWETFALLALFADPAFILKRELMWLPLFGWFTRKGRMIPVNRGARCAGAGRARARRRVELARGRQIIIFPRHAPAGRRRAAL